MLNRRTRSVLIAFALVAICAIPCLSFMAEEGEVDSKIKAVTTVYSVEKTDPQTIMSVLRSIVPAAYLTGEAKEKRLIVVGTPAEHEKVSNALKNLAKKPVDVSQLPVRTSPYYVNELQITTYSTGKMTCRTLIDILADIVPEARFSPGDDDRTLIVIAKAADQQKVRDTLGSLAKAPVYPQHAIPVPERLPSTEARAPARADVTPLKAKHPGVKGSAPGPYAPAQSADRMAPMGSIDASRQSGSPMASFGQAASTLQYTAGVNRSGIAHIGPADPEMAKIARADAEKGQETAELVKQFKAAPGPDQQTELRMKLEKLVDEHFEIRQERRQLEVTQLEARLEKIRQSIEKRNQARQQIVDRHVAQLLGEKDELEF